MLIFHPTTLSSAAIVAHLGEAEKKSDPSHEAESLSGVFLDLICTGQTGVVGKTCLQENKISTRHQTKVTSG